jgi:hypothetical protein
MFLVSGLFLLGFLVVLLLLAFLPFDIAFEDKIPESTEIEDDRFPVENYECLL